MTDEEIADELVEIILVIAEDIYFRKCLFYNVPCLSEGDKVKCVCEAMESLPQFLGLLFKGDEV